jgi:prevent-host-death family protein
MVTGKGDGMKRASIAALRAHLSKYVEAASAGEEILVTDHNKPVARLMPIAATRRLEARLVVMARQGLVRLPARRLSADFWRRPRPRDAAGRALGALLAARRDSR